jgi:membrane associated rhomboid family serine protease
MSGPLDPYRTAPVGAHTPVRRPHSADVGTHLVVLALTVVGLWALELADFLVWQGGLDAWGIRPRSWEGLGHILTAPFFHAGFAHLAANTMPLIVLGWLVMIRRTWDFGLVALVAALVSGLGIWLLGGDQTIHLGASGVIFGFLGYLLGRAYFERSLTAIFLAVTAAILYGGLLFGVLPGQVGVSWLGHSFGLLGGLLAAALMAQRS